MLGAVFTRKIFMNSLLLNLSVVSLSMISVASLAQTNVEYSDDILGYCRWHNISNGTTGEWSFVLDRHRNKFTSSVGLEIFDRLVSINDRMFIQFDNNRRFITDITWYAPANNSYTVNSDYLMSVVLNYANSTSQGDEWRGNATATVEYLSDDRKIHSDALEFNGCWQKTTFDH